MGANKENTSIKKNGVSMNLNEIEEKKRENHVLPVG